MCNNVSRFSIIFFYYCRLHFFRDFHTYVFVPSRLMDVLELSDPEAGAWLARAGSGRAREPKRPASPGGSQPPGKRVPRRDGSPPGRMHMLVGCSIARDSRMEVAGDDLIVNMTKRGETWPALKQKFPRLIDEWRRAARAFGVPLGSIVFWLSGNDAYEKGTGQNVFLTMPTEDVEELEHTIVETIGMARATAASVVVLGPLPRIAYDETLPWEQTASYKLDRKVKEAAEADEFVSLGKALTMKMGRKSRHLITNDCRQWFAGDGIHLNPRGYRKVAAVERFPSWVVLRAAAAE